MGVMSPQQNTVHEEFPEVQVQLLIMLPLLIAILVPEDKTSKGKGSVVRNLPLGGIRQVTRPFGANTAMGQDSCNSNSILH